MKNIARYDKYDLEFIVMYSFNMLKQKEKKEIIYKRIKRISSLQI